MSVGSERQEIRVFTTMTKDLLALADWLAAAECTQVAMESTGVFWKPIFALLEGQCEVLLANAHHLKAVPGHKTDSKDAEWIADLVQHGLLRPSFIPPLAQRQLRELTRYRSTLVAERARLVNRLHQLLEDTNLQLTAVVTKVTGVSARAMLEALLGLRDGSSRARRVGTWQAAEKAGATGASPGRAAPGAPSLPLDHATGASRRPGCLHHGLRSGDCPGPQP
jgi:hypothetical protein